MVMGEKWYLQTYEVPTESFIIQVGFVTVFFPPKLGSSGCPVQKKKNKTHTHSTSQNPKKEYFLGLPPTQ